MLEPCAVKVARAVLRRGVDCEINFLSDYMNRVIIQVEQKVIKKYHII